MMKRGIVLLAVLFVSITTASAQWFKTNNDTTYVDDYADDLVVRLYGSRKYNYYDLKDRGLKQEVLYRPNTSTNLGFGVNYKFIGINIGLNFPFVNDRNSGFGKTKYFDLQSHLYMRKFVLDFYGQYYQGFYQADRKPSVFRSQQQELIALRPDIINTTLGLSVQYIFNDERFSYRAAYLQNERQKKSAGSFIVGAEALAWEMRADSTLVPVNMPGFFNDQHFNRTGNVSLAVNGGYAYTLVFAKHFFVTGSLTLAAGLNQTNFKFQDGQARQRKIGWQLNNTIRFAAGYNSRRWFAGLHYVDMTTRGDSPIEQAHQNYGTGNLRASVAHRISLKKPLIKNAPF